MKVAEQTWKKKKRPKKKKEKRGTRIGIVKQSEGGGVGDGSSHDMEPAMPRWMEGGEGEDGGAVARRRGSRRRVERAKSETRCKGEQQKSRGPKAKAKAKRRATRGLEWSEKLGGRRSSTRGLPTAEADAEADPGASGGLQTADAEARLRHSNGAKMHRDAVRATSRGREHHHQPVDAQRGLSFFTVQFWLGVCPKRLMADGTRQTPDARRGAEIAPKMRRGEKAQASRVESSRVEPCRARDHAGDHVG